MSQERLLTLELAMCQEEEGQELSSFSDYSALSVSSKILIPQI